MKLLSVLLVSALLSACATSPIKTAPPKDISGENFALESKVLLEKIKSTLQAILAVKGPRTVANTLKPYNQLSMDIDTTYAEANLFGRTHPDQKIREQADRHKRVLDKFLTNELSLNVDLYQALQAVDVSKADPVTRFFHTKTLREFRRAGVDRDEATRKKVAALQEELSSIRQDFGKNIREDVRTIEVKPSELKGLPEDFIKGRPPGPNGMVKITTNYPDYFPVMRYAESQDLRKKLYTVFRQRAYPSNVKVLNNLIGKRHELATLLGYSNWAEYVTENKMMRSPQAAEKFIDRIANLAKNRADKDYLELLAEKNKRYPTANRVHAWESGYWAQRLKESKYALDTQEVRKYFEFHRVKKGVFAITEKLFGVTYKQATDVKLWHPDVEAWDIFENGKQIGRFYLDLFPRENKYKHAAQFPFRTGVKGIQLPQAVLVTNFPNPGKSSPALMEHGQVSTFLHEFGHLLHTIFGGQQEWADLSGVRTEWDFVETPSQMLEEWIWDTPTLREFALHHKTGEPIPTSLIDKMVAAKEFGVGMRVRTQMFYASLSLQLYDRSPSKLDIDQTTKDLQKKLSPFPSVAGTHFAYSFGHLNGYSAMYYTYMWSQVIAKDLFSEFEKNGLFHRPTADRYRNKILGKGGASPAADLVEDFLGRPFNYDAFESWLN